MELSRPLWNSQSALVSIRILPDLVSSSPFPSPLPCFFCPRTAKTRFGDKIKQQQLVRGRHAVPAKDGAKNEVLDPVCPLLCLPSWSKSLSYRKLRNDPTKVVTVWQRHYDEPVHTLYYARSVLMVINYLCCLNPMFLLVPVSTIEYDNLF